MEMSEKYRNYATRRVMDNAFIYFLNNLKFIMKRSQNVTCILVIRDLRNINERLVADSASKYMSRVKPT
jgi:hypothetical protein